MISIQNTSFLSIDCPAVNSFLTLDNLVLWGKVEADGVLATPEVLGVSPLLVTCHTEHVVTLCRDEHEGGTMVTKHMMLEPAHRDIIIFSTLLHYCSTSFLCEGKWECEIYCLLHTNKENAECQFQKG